MSQIEKLRVEAGTAYAFHIARGDSFRVIDALGAQVADVMFFSVSNVLERFSQNVTRIMNWDSRVKISTTLYSNMQNALAAVHADTVGRHDTYFCSCSKYVYEEIYQVGPRPGCRENLSAALKRLATLTGTATVRDEMLTDPLNCFQYSGFDRNDTPYLNEACSSAGDYIEFKTLTDLVVGVSACPDDISACNGGTCTAIDIEKKSSA